MSTLAYAVNDSATMLRRILRQIRRYPVGMAAIVGMPVIFLLLFVFVFGGTLGAGLTGVAAAAAGPAGASDHAAYLNYLMPGILVMTVAGAPQMIAISISMDMTKGIAARFRTMAIWRASILLGNVFGGIIQTLIGLAIITGIAVVLGFRPSAGPSEWIAAIGLLTLLSFALAWLAVGCGLVAKNVETASNLPLPLVLLPLLGSGFVPTDSMPAGLRWFAEYQPFTPIIETLRGLLMGTPIGNSAVVALAWCIVLTLVGYVWSIRLYNREPTL